MYTDETMIPYGRYKFHKLKFIPKDYLVGIWVNNGGGPDIQLKEWLSENIERIKSTWTDKLIQETIPVTYKCTKKTYVSKEEARIALKRIREDPTTTHKPIRSYECPICSMWHLTSKPDRRFQNEESPE